MSVLVDAVVVISLNLLFNYFPSAMKISEQLEMLFHRMMMMMMMIMMIIIHYDLNFFSLKYLRTNFYVFLVG
jgi:hypothetical protein